MNKTKRVAWHKHLKKAHKRRDRATVAHVGRPGATAQAPAARAGVGARPTGTSSRPIAPRP